MYFLNLFQHKGVRLAYIDMDEILENVDEYATASQLLEQNVEEWKKEIEVKKVELKVKNNFRPRKYY